MVTAFKTELMKRGSVTPKNGQNREVNIITL